MYLGRYYHTLEEKGRVSLPKKFRSETDGETFIITRGLDGGLFLFQAGVWQEEMATLASRTFTKKSHRDFVRLMTNDAQEVETDRLGRILIPDYLREFARLEKQVVIVGSYTKIEIWKPELYHAYIDQIEQQAENIAENIFED